MWTIITTGGGRLCDSRCGLQVPGAGACHWGGAERAYSRPWKGTLSLGAKAQELTPGSVSREVRERECLPALHWLMRGTPAPGAGKSGRATTGGNGKLSRAARAVMQESTGPRSGLTACSHRLLPPPSPARACRGRKQTILLVHRYKPASHSIVLEI